MYWITMLENIEPMSTDLPRIFEWILIEFIEQLGNWLYFVNQILQDPSVLFSEDQ